MNAEQIREYWVNTFRQLPPHQVGVIKASGKLLEGDSLDSLCSQMAEIASKGIYFPLVLGGGAQYDAIPGYKNARKVQGLRVTPPELMKCIAHLAFKNQESVVNLLNEKGAGAIQIPYSVVVAEPHKPEMDEHGNMVDLGFVGEVKYIHTFPITDAIQERKIPVLTHLGYYFGAHNINATTVAAELVKFLQAKKLVIVGETPIYDNNKEIISHIDSEGEFNELVRQGAITDGMIKNGKDAYKLLNYLGPGHSVQITGLKNNGLLEEILGEGSGTMLSTNGAL